MGVITSVGTVREPPLHPLTLTPSRRGREYSAIFPLPIQGNRVLIRGKAVVPAKAGTSNL